MASGYDGSIRIDTKIDKKGFDNGITSMGNTLKKFGALVAATFAIGGIIEFGKASVNAASEMESSMLGLQSIIEGQGRSFTKAKAFIDDYIKDGLVPAKDATLAYKNLASRGYTDTQIEQTMLRLKDAAAFGRQAHLSMGEAVSSASEGLKNENSVLVDNAGVTKNVAQMWKEYADSIGVSTNELTKQQKIQAEVSGIMEETQFQVGDAAKMQDTFAGNTARLSFAFTNLKIAIGRAIIPIANIFIPVLINVINFLAKAANYIAQISQALFGKSAKSSKIATKQMQQQKQAIGGLGGTTDKLEKSTNKLGKSHERAGKKAKKAAQEAKKATLTFDELNILSIKSAKNAERAGGDGRKKPGDGLGADIADLGLDIPKELGAGIEVSPDVQAAVDKIRDILSKIEGFINQYFYEPFKYVGEKIQPEIDELKGILSDIWGDLGTLGEPLFNYLKNDFIPLLQTIIRTAGDIIAGLLDSFNIVFRDIWNIAVFPIIKKFLTTVLPDLTNFVNKCVTLLGVLFGQFKRIFDMIWKDAVAPALKIITKIVLDTLDSLHKFWKQYGDPIFELIKTAFRKTGDVLENIWKTIIKPVWDEFMDTVDWLWDEHLKPLLDNFLGLVGDFAEGALKIYNKFIVPMIDWFTVKFGPPVRDAIKKVIDIFGTLLGTVADVISGVTTSLRGIINFIVGVFTGDWRRAWKGVKGVFKGIWEGIVGIGKGAVNLIIDAVNAMIRAMTRGLNFVIRQLNKLSFSVPDWVPGLGGKSFGVNINEVTPYQIPKLAEGAVIPPNSRFLAMLGDQTNGVNIETPLETMKQAFVEALQQQGGNDRPVTLVLDGRVVAKGMLPHINAENRRLGTNLVTGGTL